MAELMAELIKTQLHSRHLCDKFASVQGHAISPFNGRSDRIVMSERHLTPCTLIKTNEIKESWEVRNILRYMN